MNKKEKLKSLIEKGKELLDNPSGKDNPKFSAWNTSIIRFMEREFGSDNTDTKRLKNRYYYPSVLVIGSDNSEIIYRKYKSDLEKTLSELESIYEEYEDIILDKEMVKSNDNYNINVPNITLNVDNSNYNSNVNNINITFESIIESINKDNNISEENKEDIIDSVNEIKEIYNDKELSKKDKWKKIKIILSFLLDKGVDFVIAYLPQIILLIEKIWGM